MKNQTELFPKQEIPPEDWAKIQELLQGDASAKALAFSLMHHTFKMPIRWCMNKLLLSAWIEFTAGHEKYEESGVMPHIDLDFKTCTIKVYSKHLESDIFMNLDNAGEVVMFRPSAHWVYNDAFKARIIKASSDAMYMWHLFGETK